MVGRCVGAVCFGVACRDCSLIETCGVIAEAEGQEIAERFPSSQANRRALRLQAQGGFPAGSSAPRIPGNPPRPAGSIPAACSAGEKKPSIGRFFRNTGGGGVYQIKA